MILLFFYFDGSISIFLGTVGGLGILSYYPKTLAQTVVIYQEPTTHHTHSRALNRTCTGDFPPGRRSCNCCQPQLLGTTLRLAASNRLVTICMLQLHGT